MEPEVIETRTTYGMVPCYPDIHGACPGCVGEHQGGIETAALPMVPEEIEGHPRHVEGTTCAILGLVEGDHPAMEVYVTPHEGEEFPTTCSCGQGEDHDGIKVGVS
jgi:hypothetical protein